MTPKPPSCKSGKISLLICKSIGCDGNPFVCGDQCECQKQHQNCDVRNWATIKSLITTDKKSQNRYKQIEQIHQELLKTLQNTYQEYIKWRQQNSVSDVTKKFIEILEANGEKDDQLTGDMIHKVLKQTQIDQHQNNMIKRTHQNVIQLTKKLRNELLGAQYLCNLKIDSKVSKDIEVLQDFFPEKIKNFKLLYRATQNNFDAKQFHLLCDGLPNTLVLVSNQFGRVVGGFTPIPWTSKQTLQKVDDPSFKSFIFSVTLKQKLQLIKSPAVCHKSTDGPVFGLNDLRINGIEANGSAAFNKQYNNQKSYNDSQATYTLFTGRSKDGCHFGVKQWEVFQVQLL